MIEIVRPGIDGQFVELLEWKHGVEKDGRVGFPRIFKAVSTSSRYGPALTPAPRIYNGTGRTHSWA